MNQLLAKIIYGGGLIFDLAKWVILIIIVLVLVNSFWLSIFVVDGKSMESSLHDGEVVLMDKSFFRGEQKPMRGDSVVVEYPGDPEKKRYVKRVIGMPGETVDIRDSKIYVNKKILYEPYLDNGITTYPSGTWVMDTQQYFLMGDNRENSNDSRYFGPVEQRFFIGKAINVIVPSLRTIERPAYTTAVAVGQ